MNKKTTILCITGLLMLFFPGCGHHYVEPIHTSVIYDTRPYVKKVHVYGPRYHRTHRLRYHRYHHTYFGHRRIYTPKRKYYKRYRRYYKNHNRKGHGYKSKRHRANKRKYKQPLLIGEPFYNKDCFFPSTEAYNKTRFNKIIYSSNFANGNF